MRRREITCEERTRVWVPRIASGEVLAAAGSTNFMGNGLVETAWVWADGWGDFEAEYCLEDEVRYEPGGWPDPNKVESCRHFARERAGAA